ncbi:MAG: glycosyltransferase family 4 protein [Anaerolineales bacterium]|nr:glycosyltransferase family 4 protein [Anaerolineales bacterium]
MVSVHSAGPDLGEIARLQRARWGQRRLAYLRTHVDRFVGVSTAILEEMAESGIPEARRVLIPNGVDLNRFQPLEGERKQALRSRLGLPAGALAIYTGRLSTEKRVETLVRVWPQILKVRQDAQLVIVGDGPEEEKLKQLAGPGIHFIGSTREVSAYLQAADLLVLPSASEGFSLSVLEGMACGLPVVATRVGGVPDLVVDGATGLLTPVDDQAALIAGISALLTDPVRCTEMGASARRRAISVFSLDSVALRLFDLYQQVVHPAPAAAPVV